VSISTGIVIYTTSFSCTNVFFMYDHAEPMQAPNIAKFGRQILLALKALRSAGVPSMGGHLHTGNVLVSELAFPMSIGISGVCVFTK
jgi:hypothetical protein